MTHLGDRLSAVVDGELGPQARERALAHVAACAECRAALDAERRTKAQLAGTPLPELPPELRLRLLALGDPGDPLPPRRRPIGAGVIPTALPAPGRPLGEGARRPSPYTSPSSRRSTAAGRSMLSRRAARRVGALAGGTLSLSGLAMGAAFWLGAPADSAPGVPVQPPVDAFLTEHAVTSAVAPLGDAVAGAVAGFAGAGVSSRPVPARPAFFPTSAPGVLARTPSSVTASPTP